MVDRVTQHTIQWRMGDRTILLSTNWRDGTELDFACGTEASDRDGEETDPEFTEHVMSTGWTITFDCTDPAVLATFWCRALGYIEASPPAGFATREEWLASAGVPREEWGDGAYIEDPEGLRPGISFLKVREPKTAKNRVHLDIQAGGGRGQPQEARWARVLEAVRVLTEAGASVVREYLQDRNPDHIVMTDPEGNVFCVV